MLVTLPNNLLFLSVMGGLRNVGLSWLKGGEEPRCEQTFSSKPSERNARERCPGDGEGGGGVVVVVVVVIIATR